MNIWSRVLKALQGGANELGELFVDSQAMRILAQEVRDAAEDLKKSKEQLAALIAKQKVIEARCAKVQDKIVEYEAYAIQALEKNDEALALEVAEKVAQFEEELALDQRLAAELANNTRALKIAIKQTEYSIRRIKQQADTVQATETVHKAQRAVALRQDGAGKVSNAMESLERIKQRQAYDAAHIQAQQDIDKDMADESLEAKLKAAGIVKSQHSAEEVLKRIKASGE